jgi:hypothetical protein
VRHEEGRKKERGRTNLVTLKRFEY